MWNSSMPARGDSVENKDLDERKSQLDIWRTVMSSKFFLQKAKQESGHWKWDPSNKRGFKQGKVALQSEHVILSHDSLS